MFCDFWQISSFLVSGPSSAGAKSGPAGLSAFNFSAYNPLMMPYESMQTSSSQAAPVTLASGSGSSNSGFLGVHHRMPVRPRTLSLSLQLFFTTMLSFSVNPMIVVISLYSYSEKCIEN